MDKGKTAENGKWRQRQKCRNQISVLVKNAENCFFMNIPSNFYQRTNFKLKIVN